MDDDRQGAPPGRRAALLVLLVAGAIMLALLLFVGRWLLFWADEWDVILGRTDLTAGSFLTPFTDTLAATTVLVYQALLGVFGLRDYLPFLLVSWVAHFVCVGLVYRIVERRSGALIGLAAGLSLLFLGSAFEVLLNPFQMQYLFAAACGLLAIDLLDGRRRHEAIAAIVLVVAVVSSGLGAIFVGLVFVWGILRRDGRMVAVGVPATIVYLAWYLTWGHDTRPLPGAALSVVEQVAAVAYGVGAAITGVAGLPPERFAIVGSVVALVFLGALGVAVWRGYRPDPFAIAAGAALLAEYLLQAALRGSFGIEHAARSGYIYPAAIFLWLGISGLIGDRFKDRSFWPVGGRARLVPIVGAVVVAAMIIGNMRQFVGAARGSRDLRATELAILRVVESHRSDPTLVLDRQLDDSVLYNVTARSYFAALDRFGRPTLGWDWEAGANQARVQAATERLLP